MSFFNFWPQPIFPENAATLVSGASSATTPLKLGRMYRIVGNADWYMKVGLSTNAAPVATTSDIFVPAGQVQVLIANGWDTIAAIQSSAAGKVSVVEVQNVL